MLCPSVCNRSTLDLIVNIYLTFYEKHGLNFLAHLCLSVCLNFKKRCGKNLYEQKVHVHISTRVHNNSTCKN